jgi:hypothetical protein
MLQFEDHQIIQKSEYQEHVWSFAELLETPHPMESEPLAMRNAALRHAVVRASKLPDEYSETARLQIDFWQNIQPDQISEHRFEFERKLTNTYSWEVSIDANGLYYKDNSGEYSAMEGRVTEQLLSDFWFYGPRMPIPDLQMREKILHIIQAALADQDCPTASAHFELFEYPTGDSLPQWTEGDYKRSDFVYVRPYGIEIGYTTWRDGLASIHFISFETFLHALQNPYTAFTEKMREGIEAYLGKKSRYKPPHGPDEPPPEPQPPTPREKMDQAELLLKAPNSEEGAEILISLLEYEAEESYYRNYVFNRFFRLRDNKTVQQFVVQCLQGDNQVHFEKAVNVLMMWGIYGDKRLTDRALLLQLKWQDACANDPDFRKALEKAIHITQTQ